MPIPNISSQNITHFLPEKSPEPFDRIEKGEVIKVFKDIIFLQRELEAAKIELALKPDFNLMDAFSVIDLANMGWVNQP
jgi:hypothetical protein